jgi:L-aspartate oxidase
MPAASSTFSEPAAALLDAARAGVARGEQRTIPTEHEVRDLMWRHAGLVRTREGMEEAVSTLAAWSSAVLAARCEHIADAEFRRISSIVTVGFLIARAALRREESRGGHFRADFPRHDDLHWKRHLSDLLHV